MYVPFLAGLKHGSEIFFSALNMNSLFSFNSRTQQMRYICDFEQEQIKECLHSNAYMYKNDIWFIPWEAEYISKYNTKSGKVEFFSITGFTKLKYLEALFYNDHFLYLIPSGYYIKYLVEINLEDSKVRNCGQVLPDGNAKCAGAYISDNKIHFVSADGTVYSTYDLHNGSINMIGDAVWEGYQSLVREKDKIVLIPRACDSVKIMDFKKHEKQLPCRGGYYTGMSLGDKVWLFPYNTNRKLVCISLNDESICLSKQVQLVNDVGGWIDMRRIPNDDDTIWITSSLGDLWKVDESFNVIERYEMKLNEEEEEKFFEEKIKNGFYFSHLNTEGVGVASLKNLIKSLTFEDVRKYREN